MARRGCPVCGKQVGPKESNESFPLCSPRCRLIDLGNWLGEKYRTPAEPVDPSAMPDGSPDEEP
jgi:uncharacterized protein